MNSIVLIAFALVAGASASVVKVAGPGVAVVPAGLTVAVSAQRAAERQLAYQIRQAHRAAVQDAVNQAQAAQSLGNQANNAAVRDSISQANAERVQNANNLAQAARNAVAQAQAAQIQVAQSNAAAVRNAAIQALQGNSAANAQAVSAASGQALANAAGLAPILVGGPVGLQGVALAGLPVAATPLAIGGRIAIKG